MEVLLVLSKLLVLPLLVLPGSFIAVLPMKLAVPIDVIDTMSRTPVKIFTVEEIAEFDGTDKHKPIYMAVKGVVFDVVAGKRFYGKESAYNVLVGKDATRAVAKMSLDEEDLEMRQDVTGLSEEVLKDLDETFREIYVKKYPIVGYMDYLLDVEEFKNKLRLHSSDEL